MQNQLCFHPAALRALCPPQPLTQPIRRPRLPSYGVSQHRRATKLGSKRHSAHSSLAANGSCFTHRAHRIPVRKNGPTPRPQHIQRREFHDYFVTHLPSSSMHPDSRSAASPRHNLPRDSSSPHDKSSRLPATFAGTTREMTVVRIPLKSAKHHYGASSSRGTRPYQEDAFQAGTIELPAFAKKPPMSVMDRGRSNEATVEGVESASGDPQVFYFGVFDGHGGDKCSSWLRDNLHQYLENTGLAFGLQSTLRKTTMKTGASAQDSGGASMVPDKDPSEVQRALTDSWRDTVGGYFRRFQPDYLTSSSGGRGQVLQPSIISKNNTMTDPPQSRSPDPTTPPTPSPSSLESCLTYSFLRADLDFITNSSTLQPTFQPQAADPSLTHSPPSSTTSTSTSSTSPSSDADDDEPPLGRHPHHSTQPFLGGSTSSIALISTPTPTPFWHPSSPASILTAHLGDTRILLCSTATGAPVAMTPTHHPSTPGEATRLRRYAASFTTDSFGEERISGLANTRAFGDRRSKRVGVSAEPSLTLYHAHPGEFSFLLLASDGVTGVLSDQEIVDVVKESKTPEEGARNVTGLAVEVGQGEGGEADNASCVVVRMGGWERRSEGGNGPLGTREERGRRREAASDPRAGRR